MDRTGASCYVYAKASGMLAKSFTGSKAVNLYNAKSLPELWNLLFTEEVPSIPQTLLAQEIEKKAAEKFISEYKMLISTYSKPYDIHLALLQLFDYENLKNAMSKLAIGAKDPVHFVKIKPYNILNYDKWPDLEKMTANTELAWANKVVPLEETNVFANKVDTLFIKKIWKSIEKLSFAEKKIAEKIIASRYMFMNITWAMRLKVFYNMNPEQIKERLIYLGDDHSHSDIFASEALMILNFKPDSYDDWANWKYSKLLNAPEDVKFWKLDPLYFEEQVEKKFFNSMKNEFHRNSFTAMDLITWFFVKRGELSNIRKATEAIRLNIDTDTLINDIV